MAVGDYDILPFAGPVTNPPRAETVRGNDETLRSNFVAHQADTVAHVGVGPIASRPVAPTENSVWIATDSGALTITVYVGGVWTAVSYEPASSGFDFLVTES